MGGVFVGASPCALHNYLAAGEPVFLSAHSGINFYIGNNALANGYPLIPPPLHADQAGMLNDSILWAEQAEGRPLTRVEVSAYWSARAQRVHRASIPANGCGWWPPSWAISGTPSPTTTSAS